MQSMSRRAVVKALLAHGAVESATTGTNHQVWLCPCGLHRTVLGRHAVIDGFLVAKIAKQMGCFPKGWLT